MNDDNNSGHPEIPVTAESLDAATISGIEALHAAVLKGEAEQRFGLLRGRRSKQLTEAEEAEKEFLDRNGFATYNDFRLRVRRSTPAPPPPPPLPAPVVTEAAVFGGRSRHARPARIHPAGVERRHRSGRSGPRRRSRGRGRASRRTRHSSR